VKLKRAESSKGTMVPSEDEQPLFRNRLLYLGTSVIDPKKKKINESKLNLSQLQDTISERYPIDGSNYAKGLLFSSNFNLIEPKLFIFVLFEFKGIETWVSIFSNGFQMEHISHKDPSSISSLFFYPIRSLIYCGALRFINNNYDEKNPNSWCFIPLDSDLARLPENQQNPPLFVIFLKAIDPLTKKTITECHVFVTGIVKTAMKLVEHCQEAYSLNKTSVNEFFKLHGNLPVVYCMKDELNGSNNKRVVVKQYDLNGYFYATDGALIDSWQLFD